MMRKVLALLVWLAVGASAPACGVYDIDDAPRVGTTATGLARYQAMSTAVDEGYDVDMTSRQTDYFVPGRGIEIRNAKYTRLDPDKPQGLLYEFGIVKCYQLECPDQGFNLVGVRYTVPAVGEPPSLLGQKLTGPVGDPPVYELISWVKENPNGKYASTHPNLFAPAWWPEHFRTWRRLATEFPNPDAAAAGGYQFMFAERPDGTLADCVYDRLPRRRVGSMGHHWMRLDQITYDPKSLLPTAPAGLLYFRKADQSWVLGGLEYLLWAARQPIPNLYLETFDGPMAGHQATQPEHFDLHTYPGYLNPDGVFSTWNTAATCPLTK
ncbi:MAG TPA: hypothetical protein VLT33_28525 [Labilithrix sp.]|nr:hypothetical protein [Labilithrix sp.]